LYPAPVDKPTLRGRVTRLRGRVRAAAAARVRYWIDGPEAVYPDDPRRRIELDEPTFAPIKLLSFVEDDGYPVSVGRYSILHHRAVVLHGGQHHVDWVGMIHARWENDGWVQTEGAIANRGPVVIGSDVWIGYEALIMSGLTIGHGAVVGARAVVTRSVEPYEIVGGNPAKHIRYRFDEPTRAALLRISWWDWPNEKVLQHWPEIDSPDVAGFVRRHDPAPEST
jgi:carbonic anhydrase/acetyltransferase-like protein (isoleucine patch superfamily)